MALGNSMMQRCLTGCIARVHGTLVLEEQLDDGYGADGCGSVDGVLAALVFDAGGGGG
tara:strand:+ start:729 stop:902 length:174 start_codon:yes stop_codon:yes gene_type:complete